MKKQENSFSKNISQKKLSRNIDIETKTYCFVNDCHWLKLIFFQVIWSLGAKIKTSNLISRLLFQKASWKFISKQPEVVIPCDCFQCHSKQTVFLSFPSSTKDWSLANVVEKARFSRSVRLKTIDIFVN